MFKDTKVFIMSRKLAITTLKQNIHHSTIVVSISDPNEEYPVFENENLIDVVYTKFYDVENEQCLPAATCEDVKNIRPFIDKYKNDERNIKYIIVHCGAGISRSAAVAAAICEYLGIKKDIFNNSEYAPNYHVYKLMCKEFGIGKTQEYYNDLFKNHEEFMKKTGESIEF